MSSAGHLPKALRQALESLTRAGVLQLPRVDVSATATDGLRLSEPLVAMDRGTVAETVAASGSAGATVLNRTSDPETDPRDAHDQEAEGPNMATRGKKSSSAAGNSKKAAESNAASSSQTPSPVRRSAKLKRELLANLCEEVSSCTRCPALVANRTQTVFGVGNVQTRLCFFGEAPGADEDRKGEPFVGRAGQLLDRIIEACRLKREDVYILNTIKCRPPDNRTPTPEEMDNCRPYFEQQLDILRPEYICCLGRTAAVAMFGPQITLSQLRGRILTWNGARVVVTYHPAYLLRNPAAKKDTWEDMKLLMRDMGIEIPANHTN